MSDRRIMVEFTPEEAEAVSHFLNGLGWGSTRRVKEIITARERLDKAIVVEKNQLSSKRAA